MCLLIVNYELFGLSLAMKIRGGLNWGHLSLEKNSVCFYYKQKVLLALDNFIPLESFKLTIEPLIHFPTLPLSQDVVFQL